MSEYYGLYEFYDFIARPLRPLIRRTCPTNRPKI